MLWLKLFIVAIVITTILVAALGLKMFFGNDTEPAGSSCHTGDSDTGDEGGCSHCSVKEIAKCDEKPVIEHVV
ncbi:MAG: TerD family protein [Chlorobi bacterium]|nr:TerD family protein [Chlorobiota bacterium]